MLGLPKEDIVFLMKQLAWTTVHEDGEVRLQKKDRSVWSDEKQKGRIQAALSIALETETRKGS